jgi:hypothetical protein
MEQIYGDGALDMYPAGVNTTLTKRYQKLSSTRGIVTYILLLSLILFLLGLSGLVWAIVDTL